MTPSPHADIERFVRQTLGCQCPDEVFRSIAVDSDTTPAAAVRFTRIVIGDRLLLYVVESRPGDRITETVAELARLGRSERDDRGYNRFRLVVVAAEPDLLADTADRSFAASSGADERAHIHVISRHALPQGIGWERVPESGDSRRSSRNGRAPVT